jgi:hypothetical protein
MDLIQADSAHETEGALPHTSNDAAADDRFALQPGEARYFVECCDDLIHTDRRAAVAIQRHELDDLVRRDRGEEARRRDDGE